MLKKKCSERFVKIFKHWDFVLSFRLKVQNTMNTTKILTKQAYFSKSYKNIDKCDRFVYVLCVCLGWKFTKIKQNFFLINLFRIFWNLKYVRISKAHKCIHKTLLKNLWSINMPSKYTILFIYYILHLLTVF